MAEELMSPENVKKLAAHREAVEKWEAGQNINRGMVGVTVPTCVALFAISLTASTLSGDATYTQKWWLYLSIATFIAGCVLAICSAVTVVVRIMESQRPPSPIDEKTAQTIS